jgi:sarcosine oxidase subunit alpha
MTHRARHVEIIVDGHPVKVPEGMALAVALLGMETRAFRISVTGEPRGPICGMGVCFECRVTVGGRQHERSCLLPCTAGMVVETARR